MIMAIAHRTSGVMAMNKHVSITKQNSVSNTILRKLPDKIISLSLLALHMIFALVFFTHILNIYCETLKT